MGRTKTAKSARVKANSAKSSSSKPTISIGALLEKAEALIVQCDYDLARKFIRRILEQDPNHVEAREMLGFVEIEMGELQTAKEIFFSLVPPSPNAPTLPLPSAYLYLAQLTEDDPHGALQHYQAGYNILLNRLEGKAPKDDSRDTDEQEMRDMAVRAVIGMVEIWMTDLCFEPEAEETCDTLLKSALDVDPQSVEVMQCLASVRLSQQRPDEALDLAKRAWLPWKDLDLDLPTVPPLSSRLSLAKLFIELSQYETALSILQGIMSTDDQDVEAWYLQGWCFYLMAEKIQEGQPVEGAEDLTCGDLRQDSRDCLETCKMLHIAQEYPDEQLLAHADELIGELESVGIKPAPEWDGVGEPDEEDWEDQDEGDDDVDMK